MKTNNINNNNNNNNIIIKAKGRSNDYHTLNKEAS